MLKPLKNSANFNDLLILILVNLLIFYNYWIGRSTPPWDFLGGGQVEQFRFYKDGSFFNPPSWFPYGWFGIPEYQMLQDGGWFLPVALVSEFFSWNPPNAARVQAFLILLGSLGAYFLAKNYVKDSKLALLTGVLYSFIPAFYSNAQHYGVVRSAALFPWVIYIVTPNFLLKKKYSLFTGSYIIFQTIVGSYPGNLVSLIYTSLIFVALTLMQLKIKKIEYLTKLFLMGLSGILMGLLRYLPVTTNLDSFPENAGNQAGISFNNIVYLLFPFTDNNLPWGDPSLRSIYVGPLVFILFFFLNVRDKNIKIWAILFVTSIFMMMQNQLNDLLREYIPFINISRFAISDWRNTFNLSLIIMTIIILEKINSKKISITNIRFSGVLISLLFMLYLGIIYDFTILKLFFYLMPVFLLTFYLYRFRNFNINLLIISILSFNYFFVLDNNLTWLTTVKEQYFNIYKKDYSTIKETIEYPLERRSKRYFFNAPPLTSEEYKTDQRYNRFWLTGAFGALGYHNIKDIPAYSSLFKRLETPNDPVIKYLSLEGKQLIMEENQNVQNVLEKCVNYLNCKTVSGVSVEQIEFDRESEKFNINSDKSFVLIQNEMFSPVWTGNICKDNENCTKVKAIPSLESLRTWILPAGKYTFITEAKTPLNRERWILFSLGLFISLGEFPLRLFNSRRTSIKAENSSS